jgi:hypothetical protein
MCIGRYWEFPRITGIYIGVSSCENDVQNDVQDIFQDDVQDNVHNIYKCGDG